MLKEGLKIVLSGPSGSGKGTIVKELMKDDTFRLSISATTRTPRQGEEEGVHYFFKTQEAFSKMIEEDELLEYAEFCGNFYGTPKSFIQETVKSGKDILLEIEVQGAAQVQKMYSDAVFIFVVPPSLVELRKRLVGRNTETDEIIQKRLQRAQEEIALYCHYDYVIVNDQLEDSIKAIYHIIEAERLRSNRVQQTITQMFNN